jgi:hypothetical protein
MSKGRARPDHKQPVGISRRLWPDPEPPGRLPHQHRVADRLGRRDQQEPLGLWR